MQDAELMALWKGYGERLNEVLLLNRQQASAVTTLKARSALRSMMPLKIFTVIAGIVWVLLVDAVLVASFRHASVFFLVSMGIQVLLTKLAIGIYVYQLVLIDQVEVDEPILQTQQRIAKLLSSTLLVTRLLFLQLPVWTTFFWSKAMFDQGNVFLLLLPVVITLAFTGAAVWLFVHIRNKNRNKRWFRLIFRGKEWDPMLKAIELLEQVKEYSYENNNSR